MEVLMQFSLTLMSGHQQPQGHPVSTLGPPTTELIRGTETVTPLNLQLYTCAGSVLFHSGPLLWVAPPFRVTGTSTWTRVDHLVSRLPLLTKRPIQTRFRFGSETHNS